MTEAEVVDEIARVLRDEVGSAATVMPGARLLEDLLLDSLSLMTLVVALEDRYRVTLRDEAAEHVRTVEQLARLVVARHGAAS